MTILARIGLPPRGTFVSNLGDGNPLGRSPSMDCGLGVAICVGLAVSMHSWIRWWHRHAKIEGTIVPCTTESESAWQSPDMEILVHAQATTGRSAVRMQAEICVLSPLRFPCSPPS